MGRAGKATSKKWSNICNVLDLQTGELWWRDKLQHKDFRKIPGGKMYLGNFEGQQILESKIRGIESSKKNEVYEKVKDVGQKAIDTRWIVTEKSVNGEKM